MYYFNFMKIRYYELMTSDCYERDEYKFQYRPVLYHYISLVQSCCGAVGERVVLCRYCGFCDREALCSIFTLVLFFFFSISNNSCAGVQIYC